MGRDVVWRQHAVKDARHGAGQPDAIVAPVNLQNAAVDLDGNTGADHAAQVGGNGSGAGTRAAGKGDPGAALPDPHPQSAWRQKLDKLDIRALREQGRVFDLWPEQGKIDGSDILHKVNAMRIAHADANGVAGQGQVQVIHLLRQGDAGPSL